MADPNNDPKGRRDIDPDDHEGSGFDRPDDEASGFDSAFGSGADGVEGAVAAADIAKHSFGAGEVGDPEAKAVDGAGDVGTDEADSPARHPVDDAAGDGGVLDLFDDLLDEVPGGLAPAESHEAVEVDPDDTEGGLDDADVE